MRKLCICPHCGNTHRDHSRFDVDRETGIVVDHLRTVAIDTDDPWVSRSELARACSYGRTESDAIHAALAARADVDIRRRATAGRRATEYRWLFPQERDAGADDR